MPTEEDEDFVILKSKTEEEFFDEINTYCLDKSDEFRAIQARALKKVHPAFHSWIQEEYERRSDPSLVRQAIAPVLINLVSQGAGALSLKPYAIITAWGILHDMGNLFKDYYKLELAAAKKKKEEKG